MFSFCHIFSFLVMMALTLTTIAFLKLFKLEKKEYVNIFGMKFHWRWPGSAYNLTWIILGVSFFMFLGISSLLIKFQGYMFPAILCIICALYVCLYFRMKGRKIND